MRLTTRPQGVASLCPGLSHYAPSGLVGDGPIARGLSLGPIPAVQHD